MKTIRVNLGKRSYAVKIGFGIIKDLGRQIRRLDLGTHAFIITNNPIKNLLAPYIIRPLEQSAIQYKFVCVGDSEKSKSLETFQSTLQKLANFELKRRVFIIAFGGGVVGDLSGFIAAVYKRGIPYIQIPTSLLACVDSAIGGKTAVDLKYGKNLIGAFYQPRLVIEELSFLKTLNRRQVRSGLAEIIKYAIIRDKILFEYLRQNYRRIIRLEKRPLEYVISRCVQIKSAIVGLDEFENKGLRSALNFGHTLGHAIEAAGLYKKYTHGEAISLGMVLAANISRKLKLIDSNTQKSIEGLLKSSGLPIRLRGLASEAIIRAHYRDKKFKGAINRFMLIKNIGKTLAKESIPLGIIRESISEKSIPHKI